MSSGPYSTFTHCSVQRAGHNRQLLAEPKVLSILGGPQCGFRIGVSEPNERACGYAIRHRLDTKTRRTDPEGTLKADPGFQLTPYSTGLRERTRTAPKSQLWLALFLRMPDTSSWLRVRRKRLAMLLRNCIPMRLASVPQHRFSH